VRDSDTPTEDHRVNMPTLHITFIRQAITGFWRSSVPLAAAFGLASCADPLTPPFKSPQVSLAVAGGAPYTYDDALSSSSQKSIQFGVNAHSATQPSYLAMPMIRRGPRAGLEAMCSDSTLSWPMEAASMRPAHPSLISRQLKRLCLRHQIEECVYCLY
jgi:hypothetical protein